MSKSFPKLDISFNLVHASNHTIDKSAGLPASASFPGKGSEADSYADGHNPELRCQSGI